MLCEGPSPVRETLFSVSEAVCSVVQLASEAASLISKAASLDVKSIGSTNIFFVMVSVE